GELFIEAADPLILVADGADAPEELRIVVGSTGDALDHVTRPAHSEPEDSTEHGDQHHDEHPDGLADSAVTSRRLHGAVDDGEDPESGRHQGRNEQQPKHDY